MEVLGVVWPLKDCLLTASIAILFCMLNVLVRRVELAILRPMGATPAAENAGGEKCYI